jgi:hypothetical protein
MARAPLGAMLAVLAAVHVGCGSSRSDATAPSPEASTPSSEASIAGDSWSGDASVTDSSSPDASSGPPKMGGPGCGLDAAAFCETFDAPSSTRGRAGELNATRWSGSRLEVQLATAGGQPFPVLPGGVPSCRQDTPALVFPDQDALVCDANAAIGSSHLLVSVSAQNYGENSYRIRQPFDFTGRTGKIVFDGEAFTRSLLGWISVEITDDPTGVPSFAIRSNYEGAAIPQNALEIQFSDSCGADWLSTSPTGSFGVDSVHVLHDYVDTVASPAMATCIGTQQGSLNHFEIDVSQTHVDIYATPASTDGTTFEAPTLLYGTDVSLPFSRGYVHITVHNHATLKYSPNHDLLSWVARWDNVGFDGPVIDAMREYEVPDALVSFAGAPFGIATQPQGSMNVGYVAPDQASGKTAMMKVTGVDPTHVSRARLAVSSWYDLSGTLAQFTLRYRFNGGAWHDRMFTSAELALTSGPVIVQGGMQTTTGMWGGFAQMLDVPVSDLVAGDNTIEFVTVNVPQGYPPAVANVDLVLSTE